MLRGNGISAMDDNYSSMIYRQPHFFFIERDFLPKKVFRPNYISRFFFPEPSILLPVETDPVPSK